MQKKINKRTILAITLASLALLGFLAFMILALCDYNFRIDEFNIIVANNRTKFWNGFFKVFTYLGSFYVLGPLSILAVDLIWFVKKDKRLAFFYGIAFTKACLANVILKLIVRRVRPEHLMIIEETGFSFPSGHAMMSFMFFMLLVHFVWISLKNKPLKITLSSIVAVLIAMIGFSRIYLGVHYLSDVWAGWLITFAILISSLLVYNSNMFRKKNKKEKKK